MAAPDATGDTGQPRFYEHRRTTRGLWSSLAMLLVGPPLVALWLEGGWDARLATISVVGATVLTSAAAAKAFSPWGWERKHVRVDDAGLWVGNAHLPAARLGRLHRLGQGREVTAVITGRVHGLRRDARGSSAQPWFLHRHDHTVLVEDTQRGRAWLVATRHPDGLCDVLRRIGAHQPPAGAGEPVERSGHGDGLGLLIPSEPESATPPQPRQPDPRSGARHRSDGR